MSEFHTKVTRVGPLTDHPEADNLVETEAFGFNVILRRGELQEGDLAVYLSPGAIVPVGNPIFDFLKKHRTVVARRFRGRFSCGLLVKAPDGFEEGEDVRERLGITRQDHDEENEAAPPKRTPGRNPTGYNYQVISRGPGVNTPCYDLKGLRQYKGLLQPGEEVVITEKLHGESAKFMVKNGIFWASSRVTWKADPDEAIALAKARGETLIARNQWWEAARRAGLDKSLPDHPNFVIYGEVHGYTADFPYGVPKGEALLRVFDVYDVRDGGEWFSHDEMVELTDHLGLARVPVLYRGPWSPKGTAEYNQLLQFAEGYSSLDPTHVREGFVVRPVVERTDPHIGRLVLKYAGEDFWVQQGKKGR